MRVQGPANINPIRSSSSLNSLSAPRRTGGDGAELSTVAAQLSESKGPEIIDEARVERLKPAIARGSFKVNADVIAKRMLAEES